MIVQIDLHIVEADVDVCDFHNEASHSFQQITSSDKLLLYTHPGYGTNVRYRTIDAMKIHPDVCRKIKGKTITSRTFEKEFLEFGTKKFSFLLGKSDKDDETRTS
jgi:hypothetical protein